MIHIPTVTELIKTDPFAKDYVLKMYKNQNNFMISPQDIIGEKRLLMSMLTEKIKSAQYYDGKTIEFKPGVQGRGCAIFLKASVPIFIEPHISLLLHELDKKISESYSSLDIFPSPKKLPFDVMFITCPGTYNTIYGEFDNILLINTKDLLDSFPEHYSKNRSRYIIHAFKLTDDGVIVKILPPSQSFTDALAILLEEKIASTSVIKPLRCLRKQALKAGIDSEDINVISLRDVVKSNSSNKHKETSYEYHCKWIVRGHIRNQWYPSRQCNEIIWIDPHVKGPECANFKETVRHVHR